MIISPLLRECRAALDYLARVAPEINIPDHLDRDDDVAITDWLDEQLRRTRGRGLSHNALEVADGMTNVCGNPALFKLAWHDQEAIDIIVRAMSDDRLKVVQR